ncbi:DUF2793 domain-containing protein [Loktanella sp. 3ANDIMAR09]|uniref:DUF2793 domain-containing protein n=1 Tax=Loktanella sp. 3ANDIMAR09 TaxID=1225657 RepID=UPI0006FD6222|nr:DUF2793 domain-containing protein [Loktanella sp. 3ANDIMAR09]
MTTYTPRLDLPFIEGAQAQKHVTHNAALERLDLIVQGAVAGFDATDPPATLVEGTCWHLGDAPTGDWAGHDGDIACVAGGGWLFITPAVGWRLWDRAAGVLRVNTGTGWEAVGGAPDLDNLPGLGVNTASDTTNRLAVAADATLLTHAGGGHQLKVNKATTTDTASLLFQSGWSGRAEMGLAGSDDFAIKVSADGSTFTEALRIDAATGAVTLPATPATDASQGARQLLSYRFRHFLYADQRWCAPSSNTGSANASQNLGTGAEPSIDFDCAALLISAGSHIDRIVLAGDITSSDVGDLEIGIYFQHGPWNAGWTNNTSTLRDTIVAPTVTGLGQINGMVRVSYAVDYTAPDEGYVFAAIRAAAGSTLGGTRYFNCSGLIGMTAPN